MLSSILLKQLNFNFALQLQKNHVRKYFNRNSDNAYKAKQQIETKLQLPKMPDNLFRKVFNLEPKLFLQNNRTHDRFEERVKFVKQLAEKYELGRVMQSCLYSNRYILFKTTNEQLESICKAVENDYGFTKDEIQSVFSNYYRTINPKLTQMLDQRIELLGDYLQMTRQESVKLFVKNPFLIPASLPKIKETIILMLSQSKVLGYEILSNDRIKQLLDQYPEMFILGRFQIKDLVRIYQDWGLDYKEVWQLILDNPYLLNNYPYEIMPLKRKLFRYFKFTKQMGRLMIKKYPLVLMSSVNSLQAKLIFISNRLKLPINQDTLQLLQYKFSQIRPRGEILIRAKEPITLDNIIEYITMSDQDFAKKLDFPIDRLIEQKARFEDTDQIDWRRRKVLKGSGVQEKIKGSMKGMREELLQQTATA